MLGNLFANVSIMPVYNVLCVINSPLSNDPP